MSDDKKPTILNEDADFEPTIGDMEDEESEDLDALNAGQYFDDASDDSVRLYLREIGKIPLLSARSEEHTSELQSQY